MRGARLQRRHTDGRVSVPRRSARGRSDSPTESAAVVISRRERLAPLPTRCRAGSVGRSAGPYTTTVRDAGAGKEEPRDRVCPEAAARDHSIEVDVVGASHQKRRRCPCDHRGSSTVDAAICELRIEALATVLVCTRALGILPHFRFPLMESALVLARPEQARRLGQCCSEREEDGSWDVASEALDEAAAGVPHRETDVVADDGGEERENFR